LRRETMWPALPGGAVFTIACDCLMLTTSIFETLRDGNPN